MRYIPPGAPAPFEPAIPTNCYIVPGAPPQQSQPPAPQPPPDHEPQPIPATKPHIEPNRALLAEWRAHHGGGWTRADELHPAVRRLIDTRARMPAIRQRLRQLAGLEAKTVGKSAPMRVYRLVENQEGVES